MLAVSCRTQPCAKQLRCCTDGQTAAGTSARTDGPLHRCGSFWKLSSVFVGQRTGRRTFFCALTWKRCTMIRRRPLTQSATLFKCGTAKGVRQRADSGLGQYITPVRVLPGHTKDFWVGQMSSKFTTYQALATALAQRAPQRFPRRIPTNERINLAEAHLAVKVHAVPSHVRAAGRKPFRATLGSHNPWKHVSALTIHHS